MKSFKMRLLLMLCMCITTSRTCIIYFDLLDDIQKFCLTGNVTQLRVDTGTIDYPGLCDWENLFRMRETGHLTKRRSLSLWMCNESSYVRLIGPFGDIAKGAFHGMSESISLNLEYSEIKYLHKDTFKSLPKLLLLNLSKNRLQIIDSDLFSHNPELKVLDLRSNDLRTVGEGAFRMMSVWSTLLISYNRPLESIDLTKNSNGDSILCAVEVDQCALKKLFIPMGVKYISASGNQITSINAHPNNRLIDLNVNGNNLLSVANITLPFLTSLKIRSNNFMSFSDFYGFKQLRDLQFDLNPKEKFSVDIDEIRQHLPDLRSVYLSSPGMSKQHQRQIENKFMRYNITCYVLL